MSTNQNQKKILDNGVKVSMQNHVTSKDMASEV